MAETIHVDSEVQVRGQYDVVVAGGGLPGVCAAVAASRAGADVALIERDGNLGGQAAGVYTFGLDGFIDREGCYYATGIPWEILLRTVAEGQSDPLWQSVDYERMARTGLVGELQRFEVDSELLANQAYLNPNALRYVLFQVLEEQQVSVFLETPLSGVLTQGSRINGIIASANYTPFALKSSVVVDTTPHAGVAALAGHRFAYPQAYTGTHPRVAGVNISGLLEYVEANPEDVNLRLTDQANTKRLEALVRDGFALLMSGFGQCRAEAIEEDPHYSATGNGDPPHLSFFYDRDGCGTYWLASDRVRRTVVDDPGELSLAIAHLRKLQWLTHKLFRGFVPGFERAHLMDTHPHIARALVISKEPGGFTEFDIPWEHMEQGGQYYEDSVARVMGHPNAGQSARGFQVPYRALLPKGLEGLIVTGKPACRFFHYHGTNATVGQAAGAIAAVAAREHVALRRLEVAKVQQELQKQGAVVF